MERDSIVLLSLLLTGCVEVHSLRPTPSSSFEPVRKEPYRSAKPVLSAVPPVAVVHGNVFPLDHQLVL